MPTSKVPSTAAQLRAWKNRWQRVNEREAELLRATPDAVRWRQFQALFATAAREDWVIATPAEIAQVRARWRVLRDNYRDRTSR